MKEKILYCLAIILPVLGAMFLISGDESSTTQEMCNKASYTCVCWFIAVICYIQALKK